MENSSKKLFILDTCVLLNDPHALFKMGEHDVGLCTEVLNELDRIKDSDRSASYEARQVIRTLFEFLGEASAAQVEDGVSLGDGLGLLKVVAHETDKTGDDAIIECVLKHQSKETVVLVTRDMNMNIRSKMAGVVHVEDYKSDRVEKTEALDDDGFLHYEGDFWAMFSAVETVGGRYACRLDSELDAELFVLNRFIEVEDLVLRVVTVTETDVYLDVVGSKKIFGISPRNARQLAGADALMNPEIGLVTLTGSAGCGKTLLAMAAGLEQVITNKTYDRIVVVRNCPPIAEETGYLPGNETEKMMPYLQGVMDSLSVLGAENNKDSLAYLVESAGIEFKSINTMRGASLYRSYMVIEEGQNTSNNAMKALITRSGEGSKVVITGNLNSSQIDASYVTPWSNGLIRAVEVFAGHPKAAHIQLQGVLRGDIASHAEEYM